LRPRQAKPCSNTRSDLGHKNRFRSAPTKVVSQDMSADPHKSKAIEHEAAASGCSDLARSEKDYIDNMERTFAAVGDLYAKYWGEFFHFALFEKGDEEWEEAFHRTHQQYIEALRIEKAAKVLDLACGRGGFTDLLARSTEGSVLGIDISRSQLSHCRRFRRRPNLRFKHHDIWRSMNSGKLMTP
jgi:SAM-dependent methyltransferase